MEYHKSCGAVVVNGNKVLLLKNSKGDHWGFPKGHMDSGETEEQTALREIKEETGLDVVIVPGFREVQRFQYHEGTMHIDKEIIIFLAKATTDKLTMQKEEVSDIGWFTFDKAIKQATHEDTKEILRKAKEMI